MDKTLAKKFYLRPEIQNAILKFAKNREIAPFYNTFYGTRPDSIEYITDVKSLIQKGITSFHVSEERWSNPLILNVNNTEEEKQKNRTGWDLILDLDGVDFQYAKIVGKVIIDYMQDDLNIKNVSLKFSGNKGFHIGIPFEAFSENIIGIGETKKLFPYAPKKISLFLMKELEDKIIKKILEKDKSIKNISQKYNIDKKDLIKKNGKLNYLKLIEIDTILITSRHLFRSVYSFNEKSSLVSIPVENNKILEFKKKSALAENVDPDKYKNYEFLSYNPNYGQDANILLMKAYEEIEDEEFDKTIKQLKIQKREFDYSKLSEFKKNNLKISSNMDENEILEITEKVDYAEFPYSIKYILENKIQDGKKRALFVLLSFFHTINYQDKNIEKIINDWNKQQPEPLMQNYLKAQINWFKNQKNKISPPNYDNKNYYESIGIPKNIIQKDIKYFPKYKIKNPLHFVYILTEKKKTQKTTKKI